MDDDEDDEDDEDDVEDEDVDDEEELESFDPESLLVEPESDVVESLLPDSVDDPFLLADFEESERASLR